MICKTWTFRAFGMGQELVIAEMSGADRNVWLSMYRELFPDDPETGLNAEISRILDAPDRLGIYARLAGQAVGFAELSIRPFANGCYSHPVPFLEAIWVAPAHRKRGIAQSLLSWLENFARAQGYREIGSDVLQDNALGLQVHDRFGFEETERVVYFRKPL